MKTIKENTSYTWEINKSTFITKLYKIKNLDEIKKYLDEAKTEYKDATHYCYAYIIDDLKKSSDDGEPSGTAGVPIMEVLLKNELNYILAIVIRYFGGIKLGSGGLIRAYSSSISESLKKSKIVSLTDGYKIKFNVNYNNQNKIEQLLKNKSFEKKYSELVEYITIVQEEDLNILNNQNINYEILSKEKIEF